MMIDPIAISISASVAKKPWLKLPTAMNVTLTSRHMRVSSIAGPTTMSMS